MQNNKPEKSVIIVGGGWAGLTCATELVRLGYKITLLESARQLGGRARRIAFDDQSVDNGQHIFIGAYRETFSLLKSLNISLTNILDRRPLNLLFQYCGGKKFNLRLPALITPLNLFVGLLNAKGFSMNDKRHALVFGLKLFSNSLFQENDISVSELLNKERQTENNIKALWEPLCLASLNTPIDEASARVFVRVLHDTFCRSQKDADMIIPKVDLGILLPDPASDFIEQHGGTIHLSKRVTSININQRHITDVSCDNETFKADHVVLALPPHACLPLIKDHPALHDIAYNLNSFSYNPIVTAYVKYPASVRPNQPIQAMLGTTSQWVISRDVAGQPGLIAVVISGPGPHMQLDNEQLEVTIKSELANCFPHWPQADSIKIIREKRATYSCRVGIDLLRPDNKTRINGLWLAGDYTKTFYPATIESAVLSGKHTAEQINLT